MSTTPAPKRPSRESIFPKGVRRLTRKAIEAVGKSWKDRRPVDEAIADLYAHRERLGSVPMRRDFVIDTDAL